ncbi:NitT/TauT family transport system substrate-binding protein [Actinopolyspora xinjiangensis]|uniref:NitT/TauT family transport system substrate-binding protein n=1 Tax=Actinopolyspora xinjiangensis TaxID=405564 RepID=A0A1H0P593_9ACTN|nr:ABC transporter substrate-binding protein [Actinopolyspora xinjiangensis]SDP00153.1 NitT/TauT family transport system substrate-binding protein [Actinopolyspora xinjiangensis]
MVRPVVQAGRRSRSLTRSALALAAGIGLMLTSGCGLLSGSGGSEDSESGMTTINLGTMPAVDVAPLHLAMDKGYFAEEGLKINTSTIAGGAQGIPKLASGELDITFGNWVSFIRAKQEGKVDIKAVSDAYQARKGTFLLMHMPDKTVHKPADLEGKKVAVNTRANLNELTAVSALKTRGVDTSKIEFVTMDFPDMPAALDRSDVAAASVIEPFISRANQLGAETLLDQTSGPTANMPIAGYAATSEWTEQNPDAAAKFQKVMSKAQAEANGDRNAVEELLPDYTKIEPKTASLVTIGTYPSTLEASRLKSVVSLMENNGELPPNEFDINSMLFQPPKGEE